MDRLKFCHEWIEKIKKDNSALNADRATALEYWKASPEIVELIKGRSSVTTKDSFTEIERVKAELLKIITSGAEIVSLKPLYQIDSMTADDLKGLEEIINIDLKQINEWFTINYDMIDDALKLKNSVAKIVWSEKVFYEKRSFENLTQEQLEAVLTPSFMNADDLEVTAYEEVTVQSAVVDENGVIISPEIKTYNVTVRYKLIDKYVEVKPIPIGLVGYPPDVRDINETPFIYHEIRLTESEFRQRYGDEAFERLKNKAMSLSQPEIEIRRYEDLMIDYYDVSKRQFIVYECQYPDPSSGIQRITTICGNEILQDEENEYGFITYEGWTPYRLAHRFNGLSVIDIVKDRQQQRTLLLRHLFDAVAQSLYRRYFADVERLNIDDYLNNTAGNALIRTIGPPADVVVPEQKAPLPPEIGMLFEMINVEKDVEVPTPRAFQGLSPNVLHQTFRGLAIQQSQTSRKVEMMLSLYIHQFIIPVIRKAILCYHRFAKPEDYIKKIGRPLRIDARRIAVTANVGIGSNKQETIVYLQQLLGIAGQLHKAGLDVMTAQNVYYIVKQLVRQMDISNIDDYVTDPRVGDAVKNMIRMILSSGLPLPPEMMKAVSDVAIAFGLPLPSQGTMAGQATPRQPVPPTAPSTVGGNFG